MMQRYTNVRNVPREAARATLIEEGIYTTDGKVTAEYGGAQTKKVVSTSK